MRAAAATTSRPTVLGADMPTAAPVWVEDELLLLLLLLLLLPVPVVVVLPVEPPVVLLEPGMTVVALAASALNAASVLFELVL